jgi:hypothetical protein
MQQRYLVRAMLVLVFIAGSFIVLWSASRVRAGKNTCSESMDECIKKSQKVSPSGELIWESLSRQFFSSVEISN